MFGSKKTQSSRPPVSEFVLTEGQNEVDLLVSKQRNSNMIPAPHANKKEKNDMINY